MKRWLHLGLWLCLAVTVTAQEDQKVLKVYDWKDFPEHPNCQILSMDGMSVLKVENTNKAPLKVSLLTITNAALLKNANSIALEMKYEDIAWLNNWTNSGFYRYASFFDSAVGNLEWARTYPPYVIGGDILTNLSWIQFAGTRNWDKFESGIRRVPYDNETIPNALEFKLYLPSIGTVYLRPIKLIRRVSPNSGSWWSPEQSGLIGGIGGSLIGCFGGLIGWLVSKGKARKFVLTAAAVAIVLGFLLTVGGLVAAVLKQPCSVWYALLFPGVILILVFSLNLHSIQRRYDELEIRRMTSMDAGS
jgi:hypothetical protein